MFRVKLQQLVQLSGSELLLFFLCLVGLVPAAVHVAVMVTRKKISIIFHSLIHEYMSGKECSTVEEH